MKSRKTRKARKSAPLLELRFIVKCDTWIWGAVWGAVEQIMNQWNFSTDWVKCSVVSVGAGRITEDDVKRALAEKASIVGFNVEPTTTANKLAIKNNVDVTTYWYSTASKAPTLADMQDVLLSSAQKPAPAKTKGGKTKGGKTKGGKTKGGKTKGGKTKGGKKQKRYSAGLIEEVSQEYVRARRCLTDLGQFVGIVGDNAVAHQFRSHDHPPTRENVAVFVSNLHGEVSEFWEAFRAGKLEKSCSKASEMKQLGLRELTCAEEELADIIIRALDTAGSMSIDIGRALATKHAFNVSRPVLHGGKKA